MKEEKVTQICSHLLDFSLIFASSFFGEILDVLTYLGLNHVKFKGELLQNFRRLSVRGHKPKQKLQSTSFFNSALYLITFNTYLYILFYVLSHVKI